MPRTREGKKPRKKRKPKHQNTYAFKHNKNSKLTKKILAAPVRGLCQRCSDQIEWRKRYRKYKPLKTKRKCTACGQKSITDAYHNLCPPCAEEKSACAKCMEVKEIVRDEQTEREELEEEHLILAAIDRLPERRKKTVWRMVERGVTLGVDEEGELVIVNSDDDDSDDDDGVDDSDLDDGDGDADEDDGGSGDAGGDAEVATSTDDAVAPQDGGETAASVAATGDNNNAPTATTGGARPSARRRPKAEPKELTEEDIAAVAAFDAMFPATPPAPAADAADAVEASSADAVEASSADAVEASSADAAAAPVTEGEAAAPVTEAAGSDDDGAAVEAAGGPADTAP